MDSSADAPGIGATASQALSLAIDDCEPSAEVRSRILQRVLRTVERNQDAPPDARDPAANG